MSLLKVRAIQIKRELNGLGLFYSALAVGFIIFSAAALKLLFSNANYALYLTAAMICIVAAIQIGRPDKDFICKHLPNPVLNIWLEYSVLSLPLTIPILFTAQWWCFIILIMAFWPIAHLRPRHSRKTFLRHLSAWIPPADFEWLAGVRKNFWLFSALWFLSLATAWIKILPLVVLWLLTMTVGSFYQESEPRDVLVASEGSPKHLLFSKFRRHVILLMVLSAPVLLVNGLFHTGVAWVNFLFMLLQVVFLTFAILLKYAFYAPGRNLRGNSIIMAIGALGTIIPFFLPVPLVMSVRYYLKALKNLKTYFS